MSCWDVRTGVIWWFKAAIAWRILKKKTKELYWWCWQMVMRRLAVWLLYCSSSGLTPKYDGKRGLKFPIWSKTIWQGLMCVLLQVYSTWLTAGGQGGGGRQHATVWHLLRHDGPLCEGPSAPTGNLPWTGQVHHRYQGELVEWTEPVRELSQPVSKWGQGGGRGRVWEGETHYSNMLSELSAGSGTGTGEVTTNNTITPANSSRHRKLVRNREIFSHSFNENISRTVKSIIDV